MKTNHHSLRKALFLDRDGIINIDHGYVSKIEDFEFMPGIFDLLKLFIKKNYQLFILTNQSGIGRGYYTLKTFKTLTKWMIKEFENNNIHIKEIYHCPHTPDKKCLCRKPRIGMIQECLTHHHINLEKSWMIGDKQSDIDLAINAGISSSIAIGKRKIKNSTYSFKSILQCKKHLEENQDKIV